MTIINIAHRAGLAHELKKKEETIRIEQPTLHLPVLLIDYF
jgi:hypothetical protein